MQRDKRGRFVKGNSGGPGRPALATEAALAEGIKAACTAERVASAMDKLYALGMKGNVKALGLWLAYAVGKPADSAVEQQLAMLETLVAGLAIAGAK
jgi:hypothetical protein